MRRISYTAKIVVCVVTVLKMTGTERIHARNQRLNTATRHLDRDRKPTSLKGCTTTMYLPASTPYKLQTHTASDVNTDQQLMINLIISHDHDIICKNKFAWKMMHFCVPLICKLCQAIACLEICRRDRGINKCKRLHKKCYFHVVMFPAFILRR